MPRPSLKLFQKRSDFQQDNFWVATCCYLQLILNIAVRDAYILVENPQIKAACDKQGRNLLDNDR